MADERTIDQFCNVCERYTFGEPCFLGRDYQVRNVERDLCPRAQVNGVDACVTMHTVREGYSGPDVNRTE